MDKISIIMPVRNAMPFLIPCLDSIILQTHLNWELLAVNDHSADTSHSILHEYAENHNRIQLFQNKGKGIIDALNTGFAQSSGQFVTRMDADDIMPVVKLERLLHLLANSGRKNISTGKVRYISETELGNGFKKYEDWLNQLCHNKSHFKDIYRECVIPSPCWMMYREDFESIGAFDSYTYPEDYDLVFRMYENNMKVVPSQDVLHIWRDHGQRASRNDENYSDNRFLELKVYYFLRNDYTSNEKLIVWGAGKKGKRIAQILLDMGIDFDWITNNSKKINKHIYDKKISSQEIISRSDAKSIIIAVANEDEQMDIFNTMESISDRHSIYKFC